MVALLALVFFQAPLDLKPISTVRHPALSEISGIARSPKWPDRYWVHNDSGDRARIFAIRLNGNVVTPTAEAYRGIEIEGARNVDWEEIAAWGPNLYISDLGNNGNARRDLGIYVVSEPDAGRAASIKPIRFLPASYADQTEFPQPQRHFDCEAVFVFKGKVHALTKHRTPDGRFAESGTNLYRLDTSYLDRPNVFRKIDSKGDMGGWVTAASLSPDGRWIAVLTHFPIASVWIFDAKGVGDKLLSKPTRWVEIRNAKQCEAICWESSSNLIIVNEQREIFRIPVNKIPEL